MLVSSKCYRECGVFRVSHFTKVARPFSVRTRWTFSHLSSCVQNCNLPRGGCRYTKMSSQALINTESNTGIKEFFPVSSPYETAMETLSTLITKQSRRDPATTCGKYGKLERMSMYLKILGLEEHINGLNIIHVAGTKGKGSTCTFCEAILRECSFRTGLFTSPHLIDVRERFQINGSEISEDKFLLHFWECWNQLKNEVKDGLPMPPLFQFLTVLAFKIFVHEQVDVAIIEVGLGGTNDSTNVIREPIVCGVASLGMDHTEILGKTLPQIASHKAGIFKPQIPAFTVPQLSEAMDVLQERANELKVPLRITEPLDSNKLEGLKLSLSGEHQLINASLAVSLSTCWLQRTGNWEKMLQNERQHADLPEAFRRGLSNAYIGGRAQVVHDIVPRSNISPEAVKEPSGDLSFYLDGAHSPESMEACARWFCTEVKENKNLPSISSSFRANNAEDVLVNGCLRYGERSIQESAKITKQILLFNCMEIRDPHVLLPQLANTCASSGVVFSKALFVPSMSMYNKVTSGTSVIPSDIHSKDTKWQFRLQRLWENITHDSDPVLDPSNKIDDVETLLRPDFLYKDASHCNPANKRDACSSVIPSLPLAIKWLRDSAKQNPSIRLQVLVTGSLHLVGDVLKLLKS